jgi:predicted nuclease of predicted toxin-antitoxin system
LKFLVDAQLPPVLATWLEAHGHHAQHVLDLDLLQAADARIWDYAISSNCVVVTKDRDFAEWAISQRPGRRSFGSVSATSRTFVC